MVKFRYNPLRQDEDPEAPGRRRGPRSPSFEEDSMVSKRMPYCIGMIVLFAIVYVLSRTEGKVKTAATATTAPSADAAVSAYPSADMSTSISQAPGMTIATTGSHAAPRAVVSPPPATAVTHTSSSSSGSHSSKNCPPPSMADFDIGAYRRERLAATPPHIIECKEAGEGGSQEQCHLSREKRYAALEQKGATLWMTGLSGSGKSTIAKALEEELVLRRGKHVYRLDGDNIRTGLNRDLGFSEDDRGESVRRVGELSCLFTDSGTITIVSLVSPYREARDLVRRRHEEQGLTFMEVFMNVPLDVVQERDPKGLYEKVAKGEIKGFTGVDAPYEPPVNPEIDLPNWSMKVEDCVQTLIRELEKAGVLTGPPPLPSGLPLPDGNQFIELYSSKTTSSHTTSVGGALALGGSGSGSVRSDVAAKRRAAEKLPKVLLNEIDLNWLQTIAEGWAAPLKGFMREGTLLQTLHFNSFLIDPYNFTGYVDINEQQTDFNSLLAPQPPTRVSMSIPIVLPITDYTKDGIEEKNTKEVALVTMAGDIIGVLRDPEIYDNRKEEIVTRCFGVIDMGHPYIQHIYNGGDYLLGGEIEVFERIRFHDGLDKYRMTASEVMDQFVAKGADVVFAFQTRNPTHAGHAYLMKTGRERLLKRGYKNPVLWLSPLGGWTKKDDVPLDVRVKQHEAVLAEGMLDPDWTVMSIWPAPMIYGGPTEVQFHAKSRRNAGASFFVVGRDPAGMKGSELAMAHPDDDLYAGEHGRYVIQMSPGLNGMEMLSFDKVYYDKRDHTMKDMDPNRESDFISISGSKMRALARQGARPCPNEIPSDLLEANCVPPGFMVPSGWDIVCDYYQNIDTKTWVPFSKEVATPMVDPASMVTGGAWGTTDFALYLTAHYQTISPWHDIPLQPSSGSGGGGGSAVQEGVYNFVVEIPMYSSAKMEVQKEIPHNPIKQDVNKDGSARYYTYGVSFFNYGLLPQTWEDPNVKSDVGNGGDNDPLDVMEVGDGPLPMGSVVPIKVLGALQLIDGGETDHKIIALRVTDPIAYKVNDIKSLEAMKPGITQKMIQWLKYYKTTDGKGVNELRYEFPSSKKDAIAIIDETHEAWNRLISSGAYGTGFAMERTAALPPQ